MSRLPALMVVFLAALQPCLASRTLTDETGKTVSVPDHPHRILCLVPSITDSVYAIGAGNEVVGISDYVEFPAEARSKPSVGSISDPSVEAILALHPDLVLGMPHANGASVLDQLQRLNIPVYLVDPHGVSGILHSIQSLGQATSHEREATEEIARLRQRIETVRLSVRNKPVVNVFLAVSYDPVITIGQGAFITDIITLAGGHSITEDIRQEWPQVSMETVIARAPHALLMMRGGHVSIGSLKDKPGWSVLPAVRTRRVYFMDKRMDFPSPVAIDALEDLAKQFHP